MGSKTSTAPINPFMPQSVQSTQIPPEVRAAYQRAIGRAERVSRTPFQRYSESPEAFVAPLTGTQRLATQNIMQQQQAAQPFYGAAAGLTGLAGTTSAPEIVGKYISPYTSSVALPTMALLGQQQGQQRAQQQAEAIKGGAFGGERAGLQRQLLRGQQDLATGKTMGDIMQAGYAPAMQAAQTDLARQLQAGGQFGTLGAGAQQAGLQALYNQFLQERAYPFQTSQFYTGAVTGAGPLFGSTQYNWQQPQYQPFFSDPRLKQGLGQAYARGGEPERVGHLDSGEGVYSYRLTDPRTGQTGPAQIGLMSDEVRPDAVARDPQTGGRQLEHLAFEVVSTETMGHAAIKAALLVERGVRRVFALDVEGQRVLEWSSKKGAWRHLKAGTNIDDVSLAVPLPVDALCVAVKADDAMASALLAKKNPVLVAALQGAETRGEARGEARGKSEGLREGEEKRLREAIVDLCEVLDIEVNKTRQRQLSELTLPGLEALRAALKSQRRWPG